MRFRMRRKVDFPHPDGPMSAVTSPGFIASVTFSRTFWRPNHALTLLARMAACICNAGGA